MTANNKWAASLIALVAAAAVLGGASTAEATISRPIAFDEKVDTAASIVLGRCVAQQSRWDATREWILTYSTFQVEKTLKGTAGREITLVTPGGKVGTIAQEVIGAPKFREGDEHVIFIRNSQAGPTVLFFEQGAYRVQQNERGDRIVSPFVAPAVTVDTQRGSAVAERPMPLREFEGSVRETIRRREARRMEMIEKRRLEEQQQSSIWKQIEGNKILVALAIIGGILATWQFVRRS